MRALIFPHLAWILTRCFAASAARSGVTPLFLRASNTTTRLSSRSSYFCNFTQRIHQKRSQKVRNPKFSWGACPQTPPSRRPTRALIAYWNPPFQNSIYRSATDHIVSKNPNFIFPSYRSAIYGFQGQGDLSFQLFLSC